MGVRIGFPVKTFDDNYLTKTRIILYRYLLLDLEKDIFGIPK